MLRSQREINKSVYGMLTVPLFAISGLLTTVLPSLAVTASYDNDYRVCAAQLKSVGITDQPASQSCAAAIRPRDLSACVAKIKQKTQIDPVDALASCRQARRPKDLGTCVTSVSKNTENTINPAVLNYCGRSLLPVTFASCVVGLRKEINLTPAEALDTCIDANDRASGVTASSEPPTNRRQEFKPSFETQPVPAPTSTK